MIFSDRKFNIIHVNKLLKIKTDVPNGLCTSATVTTQQQTKAV